MKMEELFEMYKNLGLITINFKYMKKLIEKIKAKFSRKPLLVIPAVSCSFSDGETVMYGYDKVEIQGIWKDWATIKFDDSETINVGIDELQKLVD